MCNHIVEAGKLIIEKECPLFKGRLGKIQCQKIVPESPEYELHQFELSFSAGGDVMMVPSPEKFDSKHIELWHKLAAKPNRLKRDMIYE